MTRKLTITIAIMALASAGLAQAQSTQSFPSPPISMETLRVQDKAEELFEAGNYKRAHFIYRNELAPIGDKYSQYMVGYMYLAGKGVEPDRVMAAAWYRLAAERGIKEFVRVRDQLLVSLTPEQMKRCDREFIKLRKEYGDLALLMKAVRSDYDAIRDRTGSRLSPASDSVTVIDLRRPGSASSGAEYYGKIEERMQQRLEFIVNYTKIEIVDLDPESVNLALIEEHVSEHLEVLD